MRTEVEIAIPAKTLMPSSFFIPPAWSVSNTPHFATLFDAIRVDETWKDGKGS
jgi:hypothetical protein